MSSRDPREREALHRSVPARWTRLPPRARRQLPPPRAREGTGKADRRMARPRPRSEGGADEAHDRTGAPRLASIGREWLESRIDLSDAVTPHLRHLPRLARPVAARAADPARLTPRDIRGQVARWTATGLASKSVRERVSVLRQILDFAEVDPNPARHRTVKLPARQERELVLPSAAEVLALAETLSEKYRPSFVLLEQTAMRVGEVISLERDDVDAAGLRFRIQGRQPERPARLPESTVCPRAGLAHGDRRHVAAPSRPSLSRHHRRRASLRDERPLQEHEAWRTARLTASGTDESRSGTSRACRRANSPIARGTRSPR